MIWIQYRLSPFWKLETSISLYSVLIEKNGEWKKCFPWPQEPAVIIYLQVKDPLYKQISSNQITSFWRYSDYKKLARNLFTEFQASRYYCSEGILSTRDCFASMENGLTGERTDGSAIKCPSAYLHTKFEVCSKYSFQNILLRRIFVILKLQFV